MAARREWGISADRHPHDLRHDSGKPVGAPFARKGVRWRPARKNPATSLIGCNLPKGQQREPEPPTIQRKDDRGLHAGG